MKMPSPFTPVDGNSTRSPSSFYVRRAAVLLGIAAVLALCYAYAPYADRGPVLCPTRLLFGLPCPTCGITRACCALARGDVATALRHHALALPLFAFLGVVGVGALYEMAAGRATRLHHMLLSETAVRAGLAVALLYHIGRSALGR